MSVVYGLRIGRITQQQSAAHNGGWYNMEGKKLGWGDLDYKDLYDVAYRHLKENEAFLVLGERDSYWKFVSFPVMDSMQKAVADKEAQPGLEYLAAHARYLVINRNIYALGGSSQSGPTTRGGINLILVNEREMKKLIEDLAERILPRGAR